MEILVKHWREIIIIKLFTIYYCFSIAFVTKDAVSFIVCYS